MIYILEESWWQIVTDGGRWFEILAGLGLGLLATWYFGWRTSKTDDPRIRIKEYSKSESNDHQFYEQLIKALYKSRKEVIQYAEGFDTHLPERYEAARKYTDKIKDVLRQKPEIRWIRYQTRFPEDKGWDELIGNVQKSYPSQFKLLQVKNNPGDHLMSIVLIDPCTKHSKTFLLVSNPAHIGGEKRVNLANSSLMISGSKAYSQALLNQIELMYDRLKDAESPAQDT